MIHLNKFTSKRTLRWFACLVAMLLVLNQSFIIHHSMKDAGNRPNSISSKTTALPLASTNFTLSKQNNRSTVNIPERTANAAGHELFSWRGVLPSHFVSSVPSCAPLSIQTTIPHLRV